MIYVSGYLIIARMLVFTFVAFIQGRQRPPKSQSKYNNFYNDFIMRPQDLVKVEREQIWLRGYSRKERCWPCRFPKEVHLPM